MKIYTQDSKPYYGSDKMLKESKRSLINENNSPEANQRYSSSIIYPKDPKPYYNPSPEYQVFSNLPKDKFFTNIEIKDLEDLTPTFKNLRRLEKKYEALNSQESINDISLSGKYMSDPQAYYDPSAESRNDYKNNLAASIQEIKKQINAKNFEDFKEEEIKVKSQIQNHQNAEKESLNEMIKKSYYYDTDEFLGNKFYLIKIKRIKL